MNKQNRNWESRKRKFQLSAFCCLLFLSGCAPMPSANYPYHGAPTRQDGTIVPVPDWSTNAPAWSATP